MNCSCIHGMQRKNGMCNSASSTVAGTTSSPISDSSMLSVSAKLGKTSSWPNSAFERSESSWSNQIPMHRWAVRPEDLDPGDRPSPGNPYAWLRILTVREAESIVRNGQRTSVVDHCLHHCWSTVQIWCPQHVEALVRLKNVGRRHRQRTGALLRQNITFWLQLCQPRSQLAGLKELRHGSVRAVSSPRGVEDLDFSSANIRQVVWTGMSEVVNEIGHGPWDVTVLICDVISLIHSMKFRKNKIINWSWSWNDRSLSYFFTLDRWI